MEQQPKDSDQHRLAIPEENENAADSRKRSAASTALHVLLITVQWLWTATVWISLNSLDLTLWLILSFTENARAVRPTVRATFTRKERRYIARSQGNRCMYCGTRLTVDNLQIDHMDPVSRGGSNDEENLQALCRRCNIRKGNHTDEEFRERYFEVVDPYAEPPPRVIPQREFVEIMKSTRAHEGVREANRNRFQTPRQRVMGAFPIVVIFWAVVFLLIGAYMLNPISVQVFLFGIVFGFVFAGGLWLRAQHTGILDEE